MRCKHSSTSRGLVTTVICGDGQLIVLSSGKQEIFVITIHVHTVGLRLPIVAGIFGVDQPNTVSSCVRGGISS